MVLTRRSESRRCLTKTNALGGLRGGRRSPDWLRPTGRPGRAAPQRISAGGGGAAHAAHDVSSSQRSLSSNGSTDRPTATSCDGRPHQGVVSPVFLRKLSSFLGGGNANLPRSLTVDSVGKGRLGLRPDTRENFSSRLRFCVGRTRDGRDRSRAAPAYRLGRCVTAVVTRPLHVVPVHGE